MLPRVSRFPQIGNAFAGFVGLALLAPAALAQAPGGTPPPQPIAIAVPCAPTAPDPGLPDFSDEDDVPRLAQTPQMPSASGGGMGGALGGGMGGAGMGTPGQPGMGTGATAAADAFGGFGNAFAPGMGLAGAGQSAALASVTNYIDSAIIRTRVRVRYDAAWDFNTPDKAEYFYPKYGWFANPANFAPAFVNLANRGPAFFNSPAAERAVNRSLMAARTMGFDPHARGAQHLPVVTGRPIDKYPGDPRIDYQQQATYFEYAPARNFSAFVEVPARFLNPTLLRNYAGFSDINAGFKYGFVTEPDRYYTFQMRAYMPTGAADKGLGTGHVSLEPALLVFRRLSERLYFSGEFLDWIPIDGSDFAGNILQYGAGLTYNLVLTEHFRVAPVNEVVGWTLLGGKEMVPTTVGQDFAVRSVAGETIVNEKIGVQFGLGNYMAPGGGSNLNDRHTFSVSYGHAITGDHWYRDILRAEYNFWF